MERVNQYNTVFFKAKVPFSELTEVLVKNSDSRAVFLTLCAKGSEIHKL